MAKHFVEISVPTSMYPLHARYYQPSGPGNNRVVLIQSGIGFPQHFYGSFSRHLKEHGFAVYTYNYMGIGSAISKSRSNRISLQTWAQVDFPAITNYIKTQHPNSKLFLIGHSFGGHLIGLSPAYKEYSGFITVGTQFSSVKSYKGVYKIYTFFIFNFVIPICNILLGYFPAKSLKLGENLPKHVAKDWRYCLNHDFGVLALTKMVGDYYQENTNNIILVSIEDDWMSPKKTVDKLAARGFIRAKKIRKHITLAQTNNEPIGHANIFKSKFKLNLWPFFIEWLNFLNDANKD
ncbi:MAG: alpha/beta fold hydrolase [Phycisphaerales bacterium]|nr:alpha/beta fold hydrolase [Phycisphaerales bacterium]